MNDQVTIHVSSAATAPASVGTVATAAKTLAGWEDVTITLRAEGFPPSFQITASSGMPLARGEAIANAGDLCFVRIGDDLAITGYVTEVSAQTEAENHSVTLSGRGKTQDLVDAEVTWNQSSPYLYATLSAIEDIAGYYGIGVNAHAELPVLPIEYPIMLDYGTPGGDYIQQICRALGVLAYEGSDGALVLATAGDVSAASGAVYGENVQAFAISNSMEGRFSEVVATYFRQNQYLEGAVDAPNYFFTAKDPGVTRNRVKHVFLDQGPQGEDFAKRLALWTVARSAARGNMVRVVVDSWRDKAGKLWAPNTLVPLDLPGLRDGNRMCLSEVSFRLTNQTGTTAVMTLMPVEGFTPEPVQLTNANLVGVAGGTAD